YVLGLQRLGHEVYLIEPINARQLVPASCSLEDSTNAKYFCDVVRHFGLDERCSLLLQGTKDTIGLPYTQLESVAKSATLLLNISGMLQHADLIGGIPHRVFLDLDPAFNQLWHATQGIEMHFDAHNCFVTVGKAVGQTTCPVPTCGVQWITTLQPVVFDHWPTADRIGHAGLTTIANWRGYGSIEHDGVFYGQKAHSLRAFMNLPSMTSEKLMLALAIHPDERRDLDALATNGWILLDPEQLVRTPQ